ncbi:hypothetical protein L7F22_023166 [Adiantum nelumboides]|nr:hypothetical protein [Adiantum nelumboides]
MDCSQSFLDSLLSKPREEALRLLDLWRASQPKDLYVEKVHEVSTEAQKTSMYAQLFRAPPLAHRDRSKLYGKEFLRSHCPDQVRVWNGNHSMVNEWFTRIGPIQDLRNNPKEKEKVSSIIKENAKNVQTIIVDGIPYKWEEDDIYAYVIKSLAAKRKWRKQKSTGSNTSSTTNSIVDNIITKSDSHNIEEEMQELENCASVLKMLGSNTKEMTFDQQEGATEGLQDSLEQPSRVKTTVIVQLNKELEMLKDMNDKNAKQAKDFKEKYYGVSKEVKRLIEEASKWYNFQEEIRKLEAERESTVNKLQNDLATALKKQATYAKRKDCPKEDVQANEKTTELIGRMIEEAKRVQAGHLENVTNSLATRVMQASLSKKVTTQIEELSQFRAEFEKLNRQTRLRELGGLAEIGGATESTPGELEFFKTAAHVMYSELSRMDKTLLDFFKEGEKLAQIMYENPLSPSHEYSRILYTKGPQGTYPWREPQGLQTPSRVSR